MYGVENREKASRLLNYAYAKLRIIRSPEEREKWFNCFLSHFESEATYQELAATLRKEYRKDTNSSAGTEDHSSSAGQGTETGEGVTAQHGAGHGASAPSSTLHTTSTADNTSSTDSSAPSSSPHTTITAHNTSSTHCGHSASGEKRLAPSSLSPPPAKRPLPHSLSQASAPSSSPHTTSTADNASTHSQGPTLPQLICLPTRTGESINIMQRVGTQYTDLGLILLEDKDGSIVDQITSQYQLNAVNITREILKRWIRGEGKQPVTWKILTDTLAAIGLTELAKSILESL